VSEIPTEEELATLSGANGPGITAWVRGVRHPCCCGHAMHRHGEAGGSTCGYLGCECQSFVSALARAPAPESETAANATKEEM